MYALYATSSRVARTHLASSSLFSTSPLLSPPLHQTPLSSLSRSSHPFSSRFPSFLPKRLITTENDPTKTSSPSRISLSFTHNENTLTLWEAKKGGDEEGGKEEMDLTKGIMTKIVNSTKNALVPQDYPQSVSKDYTPFHLWGALQNIASSASYVLATQSLLSAVGAGSAAVPAAVGVTWVLKDGMGCIASLFAAGKFGDKLDVDQKRYKWLADCTSALGVALETLTPLCPSLFLLIGSIANTLKTVALLVSGSSRMSLVEGFAIHGNFGDVVAKLHAQSTLTFFLGMCAGIPATLICGESLLARVAFGAFFSFVSLGSCYLSLASVNLRRINPQRGALLIDHVLTHSEGLPLGEEGKESGKITWVVPTPEEVAQKEKFCLSSFSLSQERNIYLGSSLFSLLGEEKGRGVRFQREAEYLVVEKGEGEEEGVHLLFHPKHQGEDRFRGLFTALLLQKASGCAALSSSSASSLTDICHFADDQFDSLLEEMEKKGWNIDNFRSLRLENDSLWEWK